MKKIQLIIFLVLVAFSSQIFSLTHGSVRALLRYNNGRMNYFAIHSDKPALAAARYNRIGIVGYILKYPKRKAVPLYRYSNPRNGSQAFSLGRRDGLLASHLYYNPVLLGYVYPAHNPAYKGEPDRYFRRGRPFLRHRGQLYRRVPVYSMVSPISTDRILTTSFNEVQVGIAHRYRPEGIVFDILAKISGL